MSPQKNTENEQTAQETTLTDAEQRDQARIRLGERLSAARENKELSINEASERLRIHKSYLQGLESGDWSDLPEEVYAMGFLRQYASLLAVNVSEDIEALKPSEYKLTKPFTMPDPPIAMNRGWAIAAAACFLLLLVLFNVVDEEKEEFTPYQEPQITLSPSPVLTSPDSIEPALTDKPQPTPSVNDKEEPFIAQPQNTEANEAEALAPPKQAAPKQTAQGEQTHAGHQFRLTAVDQDVWLQLHAPDGDLLKEALLRSGQRMELYSDENYLLLTSGNPLVLRIEIDGRRIVKAGTLGKKGKVLRYFRLTPPANDAGNAH